MLTISTPTSQTTSRFSVATPGGRFKDFEMTQPLLTRQSILAAMLGCAEMLMPTVVVVGVLYAAVFVEGGVFDPASPGLIVVALLSWLIFRPTHRRGSQLISERVSAVANVMVRWLLLLALLTIIEKLGPDSPLQQYPRPARLTWALATPGTLLLCTLALQHLRQRFLTRAFNNRSVVIAGYNTSALKLARRLKRNPAMRLEVEGFFDDRSDSLVTVERDATILGKLSELGAYAKQHRTDVIFVALPNRDVQPLMTLMDDLRDTTASIYYVPDSLAFDRIQPRSDQVQGIPVVAMRESPFYGFRGVGKRLTDVGLALLALVLLLPLMVLVALLAQIAAPGPIFCKQHRYGLDGHKITIYKLRTLRAVEDGAAPQGTRGESYIGEFMRRTALDELPQLFNVLQGRMSLVGPQPHAVAHSEEYRKLVKGYMVRHKVLPGITGLAQVKGRRGDSGKIQELQERVNLDLDYLRHWSPMLDIKIMLLTLGNYFRGDAVVRETLASAELYLDR